jgi:mono/diheme cytochrome c family protein
LKLIKLVHLVQPIALGVTAMFLFAQEPQSPAGRTRPTPDATAKGTAPAARPNFFGLAPAPDPASVERGQQLFVASCGFCHGSSGKGGNNGPDLVRSVLVLHDEGSGAEVGPVILEGRPTKGMPKFSMSSAQIKDIAAFLLSLSHATVNRGDYKILDVVTGDSKAGLTYFNAHCGACHSPSGDLAHLAGKYEPAVLQARFLYPKTRLTPKGQSTVKVTLPSGQAFAGTLSSIDDFSVSMTDSSGEYRAWLLEDHPGIKVAIHDPLDGHEQLLKQYTDANMHNVLAYLETLK